MLFLRTPNDSLIPVTSIQAIKSNNTVLLLGGRSVTLDEKGPVWEVIEGTEDESTLSVYNCISSMVKEIAEMKDKVDKHSDQTNAAIRDMHDKVMGSLATTRKEAEETAKHSRHAIEESLRAQESLTKASENVRLLSGKVYETIREFEEAIADKYSL